MLSQIGELLRNLGHWLRGHINPLDQPKPVPVPVRIRSTHDQRTR